jgi:hypothetical protein
MATVGDTACEALADDMAGEVLTDGGGELAGGSAASGGDGGATRPSVTTILPNPTEFPQRS